MLNTSTLLDAAKRAQGIPSDYRLARTIGVTDNTLYIWRHGKTPDEDNAAKLAHMAGLHVGFALVCIAAERSKNADARAALLDVARTLSESFPRQTVDILSMQLRTPDRLTMPMNKGAATMAAGERKYTSSQVTDAAAPPLALLGVAWISGRRHKLMNRSAQLKTA